MNDPHCEIVHDDQGKPIARVQLTGEPTDEERDAIAEVIRAVQRMTPEQIAEASQRARDRRKSAAEVKATLVRALEAMKGDS